MNEADSSEETARRWLAAGVHEFSQRSWRAARRAFEAVVVLHPQLPGAHLNLARSLDKLSATAEAVAAYRRALAIDPELSNARLALAEALTALKASKDVVRECGRLIAAAPGLADAHRLLGAALAVEGRRADAVSHLRRALDVEPLSRKLSIALGRLLAEQSQEPDSVRTGIAIDLLSEAAALVPDAVPIQLALGRALMHDDKGDAALDRFHRAVALKPGHGPAHYLLSKTLLWKRRPSEAEFHCRFGWQAAPDSREATYALGMALHRQQRFFEAEEYLRRAAVLAPGDARHWAFLSNCLLWTGRFRHALGLIENAIAIDRRDEYQQSRSRILVNLDALGHWENWAGAHAPAAAPVAAMGKTEPVPQGRRMIAFIRHVNDLDHLLPVIDAWVSNGVDVATVVLVETDAPVTDFRRCHLERLRGVVIHRLHAVLDQQCDDPFGQLILSLAQSDGPAIVVNTHDSTEFGPIIHKAASRAGLSLVSLPNNEQPLVNRLIYADSMTATSEVDLSADCLVFPHETARALAGGKQSADGDRIRVLGSARYSAAWLKVLDAIVPPVAPSGTDRRLKIVMFLISEKFAISWREVRETIKLLLSLPGIHLMVSRHTRRYRSIDLSTSALLEHEHADIEPDPKAQHPSSKLSFAAENTPGAALVGWSDVVLSIATSISVEPVMRNKPLLEMSYLHANFALIARELPVCDMRCRDDLVGWLRRFLDLPRSQLGDHFYDQSARRTFIDRFVEPQGRSPLEGYLQLLRSKCRKPMAPASSVERPMARIA